MTTKRQTLRSVLTAERARPAHLKASRAASHLTAAGRRLTIVRGDWPHRIGTPRFICTLIGRISSLAGFALIFGSREHSSGATFAQVNRWGMALGFHARPMTPWGVLLLAAGLVTLGAVRRQMPVAAGWAIVFQGILVAAYAVGAWSATYAAPRVQFDHLGHSLGQIAGAYIAALFITERAIWLAATGAALTSITSADPEVDPWPIL